MMALKMGHHPPKQLPRAPQENQRRFSELQQDCLDRQKLLLDLNDGVRLGLANLESRVDELDSVKAAAVEEKKVTSPRDGVAGEVHPTTGTAIHEELRALKKKVGIIAANVLGEADGESWNVAAGAEKEQGGPAHGNGASGDLNENADDAASVDGAGNDGEDNNQTGGVQSKSAEKQEEDEQQAQGVGGSSSNPRTLPPRVKARINWTKVRTNRAFLVKKIRRQVLLYAKCFRCEVRVPFTKIID